MEHTRSSDQNHHSGMLQHGMGSMDLND